MNIYIDIDGTILDKKTGAPAAGLKLFLEHILANHKVFWLTSHCRGNLEYLELYLGRYIKDKDVLKLTKRINPTNWDVLKTDAIDFETSFVWFDDYTLESEQKVLRENSAYGRWIKTDLTSRPQSLIETISIL